jgi:hypothetical protein
MARIKISTAFILGPNAEWYTIVTNENDWNEYLINFKIIILFSWPDTDPQLGISYKMCARFKHTVFAPV